MPNDFEVVTTLRYKTKDNFKGAIVKIKSRRKDEKKTLTLPKKLDRMFGQVVIDLRGSRGEQKDRDQIRMYESADENWSGQR